MTGAQGLRGDYDRLAAERAPFLSKGRECASLTLPYILPPTKTSAGQSLRTGYSNFGARCVNSQAVRLQNSLLPPRQSFFRYELDELYTQQLGGQEVKTQVDKALASMERIVLAEIEMRNVRTPVGLAVRHLIVTGNVLLYIEPGGPVRLYPLDSYVVHRDGSGNVQRIIAEESVSPVSLPKSIKAVVIQKLAASESVERNVTIYTSIQNRGNHWAVRQEVEGFEIPEAAGTYPLDGCPWLPLRWTPDGSYGHGPVEEYLGYFRSLEGLTAAITKATAVGARTVFLRNPNSIVKAKALARAQTGDVIDGKDGDVSVLQVEKRVDLVTARQLIADLKEELSYAFGMNQAIQRQAERVTAEEIRYMAQELDSQNGGIYSLLATEMQRPLLRAITLELQKSRKLPPLPRKALRPVIVAGLDALGRGAELDNLKAFVADVVNLGGVEALSTYLNFSDLLDRLATARSVRTEGLVNPPEQVAQIQQQRAMQSMVERLGPNAVNQAGQMIQSQAGGK